MLDDRKQLAMVRPVSDIENRSNEEKLCCQVMDLHERFVGRAFFKGFNVRGVQEQFLGIWYLHPIGLRLRIFCLVHGY